MNCPKCGKMARYKEQRPSRKEGTKKKAFVRTDFTIICKNCGEFDERNEN